MKITSTAFKHGKIIPKEYTCQGEGTNPPISVADVPDGTRSLALIVRDHDAP